MSDASTTAALTHAPVLLPEAVAALAPRDDGIYVDGTFGAGGYSRAMLAAARCRVIGIDRDPRAVGLGDALAQEHPGRFTVLEGRFGEMEALLATLGISAVAGIALDLGVSSPQLDDPARGFSFRADGPLDMRMDLAGKPAADFINAAPEEEIADVIARFGEERHAKRIAHAIAASRPLARTGELAQLVADALGPYAKRHKIHPATRTFQALRLWVNDELSELEKGLVAAERVLRPRGRLAVVSFHSLEDRIVKQFFASRSGRVSAGSRHMPERRAAYPATFTLLAARTPRAAEIARNPRSRSARLRAAERTSVPFAA